MNGYELVGNNGAAMNQQYDMGLNNIHTKRIGLPDKFIEHGPSSLLREKYGLDKTGIANEARLLFDRK